MRGASCASFGGFDFGTACFAFSPIMGELSHCCVGHCRQPHSSTLLSQESQPSPYPRHTHAPPTPTTHTQHTTAHNTDAHTHAHTHAPQTLMLVSPSIRRQKRKDVVGRGGCAPAAEPDALAQDRRLFRMSLRWRWCCRGAARGALSNTHSHRIFAGLLR